MRELVYYVAVSLDGYIAGPDGQFDAFPMEGDHMQGIFERFPDTIPTVAAAAMDLDQSAGRFDTVVMGWNTYAVGLPHGLTSPYRHLDQVVFTRSHLHDDLGERPNLTVTDENPVEVVRRLKAEPGRSIWLCGGSALATTLVDEIDRLVLKRSPLVLGDGIPLFAASGYAPRAFDEVSTTTFRSGVVISEYARRR
ncbi:dihydrofolate reductase [Diaminobutyricimonas aerilata]|uniref:Dihydrofolate reductase n=1 Tax=Diaminobutyricimonas aerilata TaxID=1162967 RepID=A0A2M9CM29_9MICO|nr:dihydrofolate reductase family protein [Diaminobutyricimonas aerilata]PJJ72933.1 dihydrofolate reductase [Diaminobutyricimonas aerilata]